MVVLDGPMGTEISARGVSTEGPAWSAYALETAPDVVRAIHRDYVAVGAELHRTNTFRTQPHLFPDGWRDLVRTAVGLARESGATRIAGSIAPVHDCYRPDLSPPAAEARSVHAALARAFAEEGVDLIVCETFPHPGEARVAVEEAVKTGVPTWAALTAGPDGTLLTPETMEQAAKDCALAGASAVLVCCTAARLTLPYVERLARVGVPFGAYANVGMPEDAMTPARYLAYARTWAAAGASIVGACCGTGPAYVRELAKVARPSA
jgi:S-methylmethionine-dependent homocysteine/selenocysteine methylase